MSVTKSEGIASSPGLCRQLVDALADLGMQFLAFCKSLGADLSASVKRRTKTQKARLAALRKRLPRITRMRRGGISTARCFFRCGFMSGVSWGAQAVGIATSTLLRWRRDTARGCSAAASGKNVDLVLVFADKAPTDTTDPAFAAHVLPIGYWAQAVWDG